MSIVLATTWEPRGEFGRLKRFMPKLREFYAAMVFVLPPNADESLIRELRQMQPLQVVIAPDWKQGRYLAMEYGLQTNADYLHYADFDRCIRWLETHPDEFVRTVAAVQTADCLMIGRTKAAFATHPQALQKTERIINDVFSHLLGQDLDFSSGSKGFSRRAAEFLVANTSPLHGLGTDTEWPVLLHRAGFTLTRLDVDGLDWENADRYQDSAASAEQQRREADAYDTNPDHWAYRADVAQQIIEAGLKALERPLIQTEGLNS